MCCSSAVLSLLILLVVCAAVLSSQVVESKTRKVLRNRRRMSSPSSVSQLPSHDFTSANFNGLFIGISGLIGAGKSTLATALAKELNLPVYYEPVVDNVYLADFYKDMAKYRLCCRATNFSPFRATPSLNLFFLHYRTILRTILYFVVFRYRSTFSTNGLSSSNKSSGKGREGSRIARYMRTLFLLECSATAERWRSGTSRHTWNYSRT